ncbi:hypothetical protein K432DRAFT_457552 [Lepidopterella palustris CBS 459.81]|uniref:Uncharacterized protein n=1 Tax=Lepidopterella palustris CBS 459.81 TaxID=1314670 RepID=A0A8E2JDF9_9PEZI|nr:hypothetical protein K432DRAFT_457552 [Lepidopterella palustris CBS 459.81]
MTISITPPRNSQATPQTPQSVRVQRDNGDVPDSQTPLERQEAQPMRPNKRVRLAEEAENDEYGNEDQSTRPRIERRNLGIPPGQAQLGELDHGGITPLYISLFDDLDLPPSVTRRDRRNDKSNLFIRAIGGLMLSKIMLIKFLSSVSGVPPEEKQEGLGGARRERGDQVFRSSRRRIQ